MIDPKTIDELKAKHQQDELLLLSNDDGHGTVVEAVFKRPPKETYRKFRQKSLKEEGRGDAAERLVYDCLVYPEPAAMSVAFEKQYGLIDTFANMLVRAAGAARECEVVPL